ncbi:hypothetical protein [Streptomyces albiaxialis]|uniref:hypothetical protein n=1 Tax=Streptomyces albiaxialis TaxID=329523 RepID=UPI0031DA5D78
MRYRNQFDHCLLLLSFVYGHRHARELHTARSRRGHYAADHRSIGLARWAR